MVQERNRGPFEMFFFFWLNLPQLWGSPVVKAGAKTYSTLPFEWLKSQRQLTDSNSEAACSPRKGQSQTHGPTTPGSCPSDWKVQTRNWNPRWKTKPIQLASATIAQESISNWGELKVAKKWEVSPTYQLRWGSGTRPLISKLFCVKVNWVSRH